MKATQIRLFGVKIAQSSLAHLNWPDTVLTIPRAKHGWSTVRAHPNKRFLVEVVDDVHHILSSGRGLERFAEEEIFVNFHLEHPKSPLGEISPRLGTAVFV